MHDFVPKKLKFPHQKKKEYQEMFDEQSKREYDEANNFAMINLNRFDKDYS